MTVSSSTNRVSYSGNGTLTTFAYTFKIFDEGDLTVILRAANGTETVQTITTNYTVTGAGSASGGNVEFVTAPSATETVVILREQDLTQGLDLVPNDPFPAQSLEESLDKLVFMVQQHEETLGRTIKASKTNEITGAEFTISAADRANKIFAFDGSGDVNITQAVGVYRGDWAASTSYAVRDIVKDTSNNNIYIANTAHTSSGSTPLSSNADIAKWDLLVDAASATSSASAAAASETAAQAAQTAAETAQTAAETAQTAAETAETNAETAQTAAETAQTAAEAAQTAAEAVYDNFDDRYLGAKATDPTLDNDGDALIDGALYFDTTNNVMKVYDLGGTAWKRTTPTSAEQTNIDTVSGISANVTTVAGISSNVTTVAGISADVTTVAADGTDIGVVAGISANVTTVAGISSNVTTVAGISSDVTTVAADGTDIGTVATNISNVNTVAGISGNVTTVAGISSDVTTVAADGADIGSVAGSISNVNTVATNLTNINTVAGISSNVTSVAGISADVTTVANNLSDVSNFASLYRIAASDPTTSLDEGDLYYNTTSDEMKVYNGSAWQAVAPTATSVTVSQVSDLTATAAEINQLDGTADLPDIRPSLLLDFANSKTLDPRITFTRGSTATYWDGKTTAKAEENLITRSQEFDHSYWEKARIDITANATTAPDGTTTAEAINQASGQTTVGRIFRSNLPNSAGVYTASVYAKANTRNFVAINTNDYINTGFNYTYFNLSTGAVGTTYSGHTASITDVGNGWYRCSITFTSVAAGSAGDVGFAIADTDGSSNVTDDQKGIYLWGAQLEQRSSATAYTATTTSPIVKYQPVLQTAASGEARFDHDPVTGESKGLLIEEARTNLLLYSTYSPSGWNLGSNNIAAGYTVAPDGSLDAYGISSTGTVAGNLYAVSSVTVPSAGDYTLSMWVMFPRKAGINLDRKLITLRENTGSTETVVLFGDYFSSLDDIEEYKWYRVHVTRSFSSGSTAVSYLGYDWADNDDVVTIYFWGAQLEAGSFPTSYIPTSGSTVTRVKEEASFTYANSGFNQKETTIYAEVTMDHETANTYPRILDVPDSFIIAGVESGGYIYFQSTLTNYPTVNGDLNSFGIGTHKIAASFENHVGFSLSVDGDVNTASGEGFYIPSPEGQPFYLIGTTSNNRYLGGTVKKFAIYPKRLPNATLQAMTEA